MDEIKNIVKSIIIDEDIERNINHFINEEYGVSFEVDKLTDGIVGLLKQKEKSINKTVDDNGVGSKKVNFNNNCFGINIKFYFIILIFRNENDYEKYFEQYYTDGGFNDETKTLNLVIVKIGDKYLTETLYVNLRHELSHIYDSSFYNEDIINKKERWIYDACVKYMNGHYDDKVRELAKAIYLTFKTEQIAYSNQLDSKLRIYKKFSVDWINNTVEYDYLCLMKRILNDFDSYVGLSKVMFGKDDEWVKKTIENGYLNLNRRIGRVLAKNKMKLHEGELYDNFWKPRKTILV